MENALMNDPEYPAGVTAADVDGSEAHDDSGEWEQAERDLDDERFDADFNAMGY